MFYWINLIQILLIIVLIWFFYKTFIKNTSSEKLVRGLLGLALLWGLGFTMSWAHLDLLGRFFHWTALFLSISLIVIFQPELRKFFALMGNVEQWRQVLSKGRTQQQDNKSLDAIVSAVEYMSQKHTGALIVFPRSLDESAIEKKGVDIDAKITSELSVLEG